MAVDDEEKIVNLLKFNLEQEGYKPVTAFTAQEALQKLSKQKIDLIVLDIMLPGKDGYQLCRELKTKQEYSKIPIIFLSARTEVKDVVDGLSLGAEDYIKKPFSVRELISRIKAILRRKKDENSGDSNHLQVGQVELNEKKHFVILNETKVDLTYKEFELLKLLLVNKGQVCSREKILTEVWGTEKLTSFRTVDVHIRKLRRKFEDQAVTNPIIKTVREVGYVLQSSC